MEFLKDVQFSVFTNNRIEPTPELVNTLLGELNILGKYEFIPSMIAGKNIDLVAGVVKTINNISFVTIDKSAQITCMDDRIDVVVNNPINSPNQTIEELLIFAHDALTKIMDINHIFSNRLAINIGLYSDVISGPVKDTNLIKSLSNTVNYYDNKEIIEWSSRVNAREEIYVDNNELLNVITNLSLVFDSNKQKRFLCHMDINTVFENSGYRFSSSSLKSFYLSIMPIINRIKNDFVEKSNG